MKEFDYSGYLRHVRLNKGDIVDVCSDMISVLMYCRREKRAFEPDHLIDALQDAVGPDGTVMIRTFSWDFCKGITWDILTSPSRVGSFGNCTLERADFVRTHHPLYSWMVWGKYAETLQQYENVDGFDDESIFQFLEEHNGRQLTIGNLMNNGMTMVHHAEAAVNVPYRKQKFFEADYIDLQRTISKRRYSMYVRPLNIDVKLTPFVGDETQKLLRKRGIRDCGVYDSFLKIETVELPALAGFVKDDLLKNDGRTVVMIDGKPGIWSSGADLSRARYY